MEFPAKGQQSSPPAAVSRLLSLTFTVGGGRHPLGLSPAMGAPNAAHTVASTPDPGSEG